MKISTMALCSLACATLAAGSIDSAAAKGRKIAPVITENVDFAARQVRLMVDTMDTFRQIPSPRTTDKNGRLVFTSLDDWTSGFFREPSGTSTN